MTLLLVTEAEKQSKELVNERTNKAEEGEGKRSNGDYGDSITATAAI